MDFRKTESKYFSLHIWTGDSALIPLTKFDFIRKLLRVVSGVCREAPSLNHDLICPAQVKRQQIFGLA